MIEVAQYVVRICRLRKLSLVTLEAIRVHKLIVIIDVTRLTLCAGVPSCQCKARCCVVKGCGSPRRLRMTLQTIVTELTLLMIWVRRSVKRCGMTIPTGMRQALVLIVDVTQIAGRRLMRSNKRERRVGVTEC